MGCSVHGAGLGRHRFMIHEHAKIIQNPDECSFGLFTTNEDRVVQKPLATYWLYW